MHRLNRRRLLGGTAGLAFAIACPGLLAAREYRGGMPWAPREALPPDRFDPERRFLTPAERSFVTAAVDRLIPADEWPSASELGVVDFIDFQLAGAFGRGDIFYMQGPFREGTESQGYQSREPAWLYRRAIAAIEEKVAAAHGGTGFAELDGEAMDDVLSRLQDGSLELEGVSGTAFFAMLLQNTKEGYFGDPVHGGNRGMAAWRMLGFPGARYDYRPHVGRHNQRLDLEPVSVAGFSAYSIHVDEAER